MSSKAPWAFAADGRHLATANGTVYILRLHDMHGNVWEWCADWFSAGAYKTGGMNDPQGPPAGSLRVDRGGAFHSPASVCRAAYREKSMVPSARGHNTGFRVVMDK